MDLQTSVEQVAGILARAELTYSTHPDGDAYQLPFGRDAVVISFDRWGRDGVVVTVTSPVLQGIDPDGAGAAVVHQRLGDLNRRQRFVKFVFVGGDLIAASDVLGDGLRAEALLNAVYAVAGAAARAGDELEEATGGTRFDDVEATADEDIPF